MVSSNSSNKFQLQSKYFNFHSTQREQNLVNSLIKEAISKNGINMLYIPRQFVNLDKIYGEDVLSSFTRTFEMVFYVESSESYAGNGSFFGNLGFDIQDQSSIILSKDVFKEIVVDSPQNTEGQWTVDKGPKNGDLIYWPTTSRLFEIVDVENYKMFYQLGKLYTYKLTIEFFDYSNEKLKTNLPEIDNKFVNDIVKKYEIKLTSTPTTPFTVGEQVYTGAALVTSEFVGEVESYSAETRKIVIASAYGLPVNGQTLTGDTSSATADILDFIVQNAATGDGLKDNQPLEEKAAEVIVVDPEDDGYGY